MKKYLLLLALCATGWLSLPADAQNPTNTFARFRFSYGGTVFGDMEVELFNQDKPVTVSNFLYYVRSGGYQNTFIHRASPGLGGPTIIQGGGFRVINPFSAKLFTDCGYEEIAPTNSTAAIINESQISPIYTNGPGTLAMATQDGDPDSARASWFFNLVNNPSLETKNGGFAVFGRVTKDPKKILNYFRSIQWSDGIMDPYTSLYCGEVPGFFELPIAARPGIFCPAATLLFVVDITELNSTNRADISRPTLTLTTPTSHQRLFDDTALITGKALDKGLGLAEVRVYPSPCDALVAIGTMNWSLSLTGVPPGTNIIEVESVDAAGNRSAIIRRTFFRVLGAPVTLTNTGSGSGKITGATNGQMVEIGRDYILTAKANAGSLFAGWRAEKITYTATNSTTYAGTENTASVRFRADSNLTFQAMFVTNPFPPLVGTYVGLFYHTNFYLSHDYSGALKFTLTSLGRFTGSAQFGSKSYPFSGTFHPATGLASIGFKGPGGTNLIIQSLRLNLTNNEESVSGVIAYTAGGNSSLHWASAINAHRVHSGTAATPSPYTGSYTWLVPGEAEPTVRPSGDSFGRFTVSKTGTLDFTGIMADGTPVTAGTMIGTNGLWPLRAHFNNGFGSILSWVTVDTTRLGEDLYGAFYWFQIAPGWTYATYTGTIQTNGTNFLLSLGGAGDVYIDDLKLVVGTDLQSGSNLLVNAGFEEPLAGTWTGLGNHSSSTDTASYAHTGSRSLRILASGNGGTSAAVQQILQPFPSNTVCTLGFYYLPSPSGTKLTVRTTPGSRFTKTFDVGSSLTTLLRKKFYPDGFTIANVITGSRYVAPMGTTNRVLTNFVTSGSVALLDGNLPGPQTNLVTLLPNNTVTNQSTNKLTFVLTKTTGLFTGTVAPTNQTKIVTYKGAILQKQGYGSGFHLGTNKSGRVYFGP